MVTDKQVESLVSGIAELQAQVLRKAIRAMLEEFYDNRKQSTAQPSSVMVPVKTPDDFVAWIEREIPPGTVISNPKWWAPKIYRAMLAAAKEPK